MNKILPYFILNNVKYEIKPTRYLLAEYDKRTKSAELSPEEKQNGLMTQKCAEELKKWAEKVKELETKFLETFDGEDERRYKKAKEYYDEAYKKFVELESTTNGTKKLQDLAINILEQIAILGLAEQYFENDTEKAQKTWESYVDEIGTNKAVEWLTFMSESLFGEDEGDSEGSFLYQMKKAKTHRK